MEELAAAHRHGAVHKTVHAGHEVAVLEAGILKIELRTLSNITVVAIAPFRQQQPCWLTAATFLELFSGRAGSASLFGTHMQMIKCPGEWDTLWCFMLSCCHAALG